MATPDSALSNRQRRLYTDRVDLYARKRATAAAGVPGGVSFPLTESGVRGYRQTLDSTSEPTLAGRQEVDNMLTIDQWHFAEHQEIDEGWWIRDVTPGSETYGRWWITRGQPVRIPQRGKRQAGHTHIRASQSEEGPPGWVDT